jgi:hypothetical protein
VGADGKLAGRRKTRRPAKKLPTGEKAADRQKSCQLEKLLTGENSFASQQLFRRSAAIWLAGEFSSVGSVFASRQLFRRPAAFLPAGSFFASRRVYRRSTVLPVGSFCQSIVLPVGSFSPAGAFFAGQQFGSYFAGRRVFRRSTVLPAGELLPVNSASFCRSTLLPVGSFSPAGAFFTGQQFCQSAAFSP